MKNKRIQRQRILLEWKTTNIRHTLRAMNRIEHKIHTFYEMKLSSGCTHLPPNRHTKSMAGYIKGDEFISSEYFLTLSLVF